MSQKGLVSAVKGLKLAKAQHIFLILNLTFIGRTHQVLGPPAAMLWRSLLRHVNGLVCVCYTP